MSILRETSARTCIHVARGCKWRGLDEKLQGHLEICAFEQLTEYFKFHDEEIKELKEQIEHLEKKLMTLHADQSPVNNISLQAHTAIVVALAFSDKILFSGSMDGTLKLWDLSTFTVIREISIGPVFNLKLHAGYMFSGHTNEIKVWDLNTFIMRSTLTGHTGNIKALCVRGNRLFSGAADKSIKVWDLQNGDCILTLKNAHDAEVRDLVDISDEQGSMKNLWSCSDDHTIKVWDSTFACQKVLIGHKGPIRNMVRIGDIVFSGSDDTYIKLWSVASFQELRSVSALVGITAMTPSFASSTPTLVTGHSDGVIKIWNLQNLEKIECEFLLPGHSDSVRSLVVAGNALVSGGYDKTIKIWIPR